MANIVFWLTGDTSINGDDHTTYDLNGRVIGDEGSAGQHDFVAVGVDVNALAATVNAAVRDAAIAAFEAAESPITVGALDKKTFLGGAVGL